MTGPKDIINYDEFIACFESVPLMRRDDAILAALRGINDAVTRARESGSPVRVTVDVRTPEPAIAVEVE